MRDHYARHKPSPKFYDAKGEPKSEVLLKCIPEAAAVHQHPTALRPGGRREKMGRNMGDKLLHQSAQIPPGDPETVLCRFGRAELQVVLQRHLYVMCEGHLVSEAARGFWVKTRSDRRRRRRRHPPPIRAWKRLHNRQKFLTRFLDQQSPDLRLEVQNAAGHEKFALRNDLGEFIGQLPQPLQLLGTPGPPPPLAVCVVR